MNAKKELEKARDEYDNRIEEIARREFERVIKPYLKKNKISMVVGMGGYSVGKRINGKWTGFDVDDLPKYILDVLEIEVDHYSSNNYLGCFMPDYDGE